MAKNLSLLVCAAVLVTWGASSHARASDADSAEKEKAELIASTRIYGGAWFGFKGSAQSDGELKTQGDVNETLGGQVGIEQVLWRHLSLGAEARLGASKWKETGERTKLVDINLKPRLRFPLQNTPIELYVAVPVGLTVPRDVKLNDEDAEEKLGWNIGAGPGLNIFLTDWLGVNAEPVWLVHHFAVEKPEQAALKIKQFSAFVNAVIAL